MLNESDWTDKKAPVWFIMLPTGHEGPYSLEVLEKKLSDKKLGRDIQVWREGLPVAISLRDVLSEIDSPSDELPPPLPPLPDEDIPEIPEIESYDRDSKKALPVGFIVAGLAVILVLFGFYQWIKDREVFEIRRYPKMTLNLHQKIQKELKFEGFDKKLFFHEFISPDYTHIWLVTSGYQSCDVEAVFRSENGRLLTMGEEEVELVGRGKLSGHVTEMNVFEFRKGSKIIPGLYEIKVKATRCEWDGLVPRLRNFFSPPDSEYEATTKVVLYSRGAEEFQEVLTQLLQKKENLKNQAINQRTIFWDELQMKFSTLQAFTVQIEQHFLDFLDKGHANFHPRLKIMVDQYTKKFGQALTQIVIDNETFFAGIQDDPNMRPVILKKDYEGIVRAASKQVGFESMTVMEKLQSLKKPTAKDLQTLRPHFQKSFENLKSKINLLLIGVTEDRSKSP